MNMIRCLLSALLVVGCSGSSKSSESLSAVQGPPPVDLSFVRELISEKNVTSIEALLENLPEDYRSHFVLMNESNSSQEANGENPRAILSGRLVERGSDISNSPNDAVMAFNGDPTQSGHEAIELIQWRPESRKFEFAEITFSEKKPKITDSPKKCLGCHARGSSEAYPIWDIYGAWPGAYGGDDGNVKIGSREDAGFKSFLDTYQNHPRYKFLIFQKDKLFFDKSKFEYYTDVLKYPPAFMSEFPKRHGYYVDGAMGDGLLQLSQKLDSLNALRIRRMVKESPHFSEFMNVPNCFETIRRNSSTEEYAVFQTNLEEIFGQQWLDRKQSHQASLNLLTERVIESTEFAKGTTRDLTTVDNLSQLSAFEYTEMIARKFLNIDVSQWALPLYTSTFISARPDGGSTPTDFEASFYPTDEMSRDECANKLYDIAQRYRE